MPPIAIPRPPIAHQDPAEDRLLAMVAALASELAVVRERLDTIERLAESETLPTAAAIEAYQPDPAAAAARTTLRQRLIAKVFRPLRDDAERAAHAA